jgi:hypothetical protein
MKPIHCIVCPLMAIVMNSCSTPSGMTIREYSELSGPSKAEPFPESLTLALKDDGRLSRALPSVKIKPGKPFTVAAERDFVYPAAYKPAVMSSSGAPYPITPATPTDFRTEKTGFRAELSASRKGALVLIEGLITVKEFDGFTKMGGLLGKPIVENDTVLTENRIEMPKFSTYTTPVYVFMKPGTPAHFEISHPKKGATVTVTLGGK